MSIASNAQKATAVLAVILAGLQAANAFGLAVGWLLDYVTEHQVAIQGGLGISIGLVQSFMPSIVKPKAVN